ncbi:MAG: malectin domain-containing carbohydrate-binding protein [Armatimonadota bacterium]|nr:hypothetical protein [bacterium]
MIMKIGLVKLILLLVAIGAVLSLATGLTAQTTKRVSVTSGGVESDGESFFSAVSGDGRYVAFSSWSTNLVPGGTNGWLQVLRADLDDGSIIDASLDYLGQQATIYSWFPTISADGNRVCFTTNSTALVPGPEDYIFQAYARDVSGEETILASCSVGGNAGNDESYFSAISGDGNYVAFSSFATNITPDGSTTEHVYVKNLQTGSINRASVNSDGEPGNGRSSAPYISYDGRYAIFSSDATNLVDDDTNGVADVFVRDMLNETTERVNVSSTGEQANGGSDWPTISGDGRYAAFECSASNLVTPNTASGRSNVYVYDRDTGTIQIVSVDSAGNYGNAGSSGAVISLNGKYVVFNSDATNLVATPNNGRTQVYTHRMSTGETIMASVNSAGVAGDNYSDWQSVSGDGRVVAFASYATNLVSDDTNNERDIYVREIGPPYTVTAMIDCGGPKTGNWIADAYYKGGKAQYTSKTISNTGSVPVQVYQTQRTGRFSYIIPNLESGAYTINLHFAETVYSKKGARIFDVVVNGITVLSRFDIYSAAGCKKNTAVVKSVSAEVAEDASSLTITFVPIKTDAAICGIEVWKLFE